MRKLLMKISTLTVIFLLFASIAFAQREMENLGRGIVAVRTGTSNIFVSWRLLGLDPVDIGFNLYRSTAGGTAIKLNGSVLTAGTNYTDITADITKDNAYYVKPVISSSEQTASGSYTVKANTLVEPCIVVPLTTPASGYYTKFVWVGDLDGDGEYEYVIDRLAPFSAATDDIGLGNQYLEAYTRTGTRLWVIDMGPSSTGLYNISPGAATISMGMYDGVTVYDMNSDGKAEVILKIANGVKFPDGTTFTNSDSNKQFIAIVNGQTGNLVSNLAFPTDFYAKSGKYGTQLGAGWNGATPIIYGWLRNRNSDKSFNDIIVAWTWNGTTLSQAWKLPIPSTTSDIGCFHQMQIADVDGDGKDELLPGNFTINSNGTIRYKMPGIGHGDRHYVAKMDPNRAGLQGYGIQQDRADFLQDFYYDANTGEVLWKHYGTAVQDMARGLVGDIDPNNPGWEAWTFNYLTNAPTKTKVSDTYPYPCHTLWWDGDLLSENLNDTKLEKWNYVTKSVDRLETLYKYESGTIAGHNPMLSGDIFGDWRTEIVCTSLDYSKLVIFTTNVPTNTRIYTMAQNPLHRSCMTIKGYYESPLVDYYLGSGMATPPVPNIKYAGTSSVTPNALPVIVDAINSRGTLSVSPNPLTGNSITLKFGLISSSDVKLIVYLNDKIIIQRNLGVFNAGNVVEVTDISSLPKGTYIVCVQTNEGIKTSKLIRQ